MDNRNLDAIVPYHDPTVDVQPGIEQIFRFSNEGIPPSLQGFDQEIPPSILSNFVPISSYCMMPASSDFVLNPSHYVADSSNYVHSLSNSLMPSSNVDTNINSADGIPEPLADVDIGVLDGVPDPIDPMSDPFFWDSIDLGTVSDEGLFFGGSSPSAGDGNYNDNPQRTDFGNPISIPSWPIIPSAYTCCACHTLREIIHTNGEKISNLEIHGRLGVITHAILDIYDFDFSTANHTYLMYDFCKESIISIQNFLLQYCEFRKMEGYIVVEDPLSVFYRALCVGIHEMENQQDSFLQPAPMATDNDTTPRQEFTPSQQNPTSDTTGNASENCQQNPRQEAGESSIRGGGERLKTKLALQRERTRKMKAKDFAKYFHLPINEAAELMQVCPTVIKKKCRDAGLHRWPFRTIKGIRTKISTKNKDLENSNDARERKSILAEKQMLVQGLVNFYKRYTGEEPSRDVLMNV